MFEKLGPRRIARAVLYRARFGARTVRTTRDRRLQHATGRAQLVSLDVFDTAIFRCVPQPADAFEIVAHRLARRRLYDADPRRYRAARIEAESQVRSEAGAAGIEEVTLAEIIERLALLVPSLDASAAMEEELDVERTLCVANADVLDLYGRMFAAAKPVAFLSDTYFSHDVVAGLLESAGYARGHRLFTSSTVRKTKERGTLYGHAAREMHVAPREIAHLGDNRRPDVVMAAQAGVRGYWYRARLHVAHDARDDRPIEERVRARIEAVCTAAAPAERANRWRALFAER